MPKKRDTSKPYRPRVKRPNVQHFLREWRLYRNLTQERAAERAEMSVASISQLENGDQSVSDRTLSALAYAYNCEIADLFRDPSRHDYQLWRVITGLKPEKQAEVLRVVKAMTEAA